MAVCGIAGPEGFETALAQLGLAAEEILVFRDHHRYRERDRQRIRRTAERTGSSWILTTEKDAVKLAGQLSLPLVAVRLAVEILEPTFFPFLASRLPARSRAGEMLPQ